MWSKVNNLRVRVTHVLIVNVLFHYNYQIKTVDLLGKPTLSRENGENERTEQRALNDEKNISREDWSHEQLTDTVC